MMLLGIGSPISCISFLNSSRSSCLFDAFPVNAQKLCAVFFQNAFVIQLHSQIQTCLSSKSCQHAVRTFLVQDLFQRFLRQRFHIYFIRDSFISHDGGRVAVDQDRFDAFLRIALQACVPA